MIMKGMLFLWMLLLLRSGSHVTAQDGSGPSGNDTRKLQIAINIFQLQLYKELAKTNPNLICSGYGVATTLNMLLAGARTTTEKELMDVLGYNAVGLNKHHSQVAYHDVLTKQRNHDRRYELNINNTISFRSGAPILPQYRRILRNVFYSREEMTNSMDVNSLLSSRLTNEVPNILDASVDNSTLGLFSVTFFNATWKHEFNKNLTVSHPFHNGDTTTNIPFMNTINVFNYSETEDVQVLVLPYHGDELLMIVILPKTVNGLPDFEKSLNLTTIAMFRQSARSTTVHVQIPKFSSVSNLKLSDALKSLGMKDSFTHDADFTGIETRRGLYVSEAAQLAVMGVTEDGSAGASVSVSRVKRQVPAHPRPIEFIADHPFLYAVFHQPTGVVLFLGRMSQA